MSVPTAQLAVVVPAYNAGRSIAAAVSSAFAVGAGEVIVVDDGSTDDTAAIAERAGAKVIRQSNQGASVARRAGLAAAAAPYIVMLDADDTLLPDGVARSLAELRDDQTLSAVGGAARGVLADGAEVRVVTNDPAPSLASLLRQGFAPVPPACFVWRTRDLRRALLESDPPPLLPRYAEDYEMLVRVAALGAVRLHTEPSARYALVGGKSMVDPSRSVRAVAEMRAYYAEHSGIAIPQWGARQIRARGHLRRYKNADGRAAKVRHLAMAGINDPSLVWGLVRARLRRGQ